MGYLPPHPPSRPSPTQASVDDSRRHDPMVGPYRRYLLDLYGEPGRDWMPVLTYTFLAALIALVLVILWAVAG